MECMITTFAHGNGPYSRIIDLGLAINERLDERLPIIVPLVYGDRQKKIISESFGENDLILFDEFYGDILNELFFKKGHYQRSLEFLLENQPRLEEKLRDYLSGTLRTHTFDGREVLVNGDDVAFEISHNPRVATGYEKSFHTTIGFFSEILTKTIFEGLGFCTELLKGVRGIVGKIEDDKTLHFMPEPFVFSYDGLRKRWKDEIFTPPFIHIPKESDEGVSEGMYVMLTGIDGLKSLFEGVHKFGMKLYCPPFVNLEDADNNHTPEFIVNPNIRYQFARTGWSSVWLSHMTETPLITPAYSEGDDPEIYFNEKTVKALKIATIFDGLQKPEEILVRADSLRPNLELVNKRLIDNYGTLDGVDYTARIIVDYLEGRDISSCREVEPCLK